MQDIKRLGCGGFLSECNPDSSVFDVADEYKQGWMIWEYKPFLSCMPSSPPSINYFYNNGSINMHMASELSRTYAQVVAGTDHAI